MLITLTTDFGLKDSFAGIMHAVIYGINPEARVVDLTHGIGAQNTLEAAITIDDALDYLPSGSINVVVVDPGVGSGRRPLLIEKDGRYFIGPDNGVFTAVLNRESETPPARIFNMTSEKYFLRRRGPTFHGRDVFSPAAAWLSLEGVRPEDFGPAIDDPRLLNLPEPVIREEVIEGEILFLDHFGNAITNIRQKHLEDLSARFPAEDLQVTAGSATAPLYSFYSEAPAGSPGALLNSSQRLEIFLYEGNASASFGLSPLDRVLVHQRAAGPIAP